MVFGSSKSQTVPLSCWGRNIANSARPDATSGRFFIFWRTLKTSRNTTQAIALVVLHALAYAVLKF